MAMMQLQRTRNAPTVTKIDQKQSLEVIQTMLHGSLSTLSYLREFFSEKVFERQLYEMADHIHSYEDYAAGKLAKHKHEAAEPAITMCILKRGCGKRADLFLDWLVRIYASCTRPYIDKKQEKGAFTALQAGNLRALQVYVHADKKDRTKVIEMYTFTIKYGKDGENGMTPNGLELDSPGNELVTVEATNQALQTLLHQLCAMCERLPALPEQRFISMELFYIPDREQQQKSKDFVPGTDASFYFPEAEGWERESESLGELGAQFHGSTLNVTSLTSAAHRGVVSAQPIAFPTTLKYTKKMSKVDLIRSASLVVKSDKPTEAPPAASPAAVDATTPSTIIEEARDNTTPDEIVTESVEHDTIDPSMLMINSVTSPFPGLPALEHIGADAMYMEDSINTQSGVTMKMKSAVGDMMQPQSITQGDTQTQHTMHPPPPAFSESTESPGRTTVSPPKSIITPAVSSDRPMLSPTKAHKLAAEIPRLQQQALDAIKQAGRRPKGNDTTLCQCGYEKEEDEMVRCGYCKTWQHLPCYGYTDADDPRLPEDHTCYQCLLGDGEKVTLTKLQDLAMTRRAMDFALQHGLKTQGEFAADLELSSADAQKLYKYLTRESGFIVQAAGSHKAGYKASGKPLFVPTRDAAKHEQMLSTLFDPLMHISHHYTLPARPATQANSLTLRLLAAQASDMPPPATPASQLRSRDTTTPASGLDLTTGTPLKTPSRTFSQSNITKKRSSNQALRGGTPAKRVATPDSMFARMKSMQSRYLIDANGLDSSPAGSANGY
ncbi:hypothetical protein LTR42_002570 [Elasticomyces elasticus]|nr:hypothetical protein LTR42_002570 [Elasticomyces elasticus]